MKAYGIKKWPVIILIVLPGLIFAPVNFAAAWFFANWKINKILICAALLQLVGGWFRALSFIREPQRGSFSIIILGTFIFFLASPFILNSISIIANMWFAEKERARAMAIAGLMAPLGSLLGLGLTGYIIIGINDDPVECMNRLKKIVYYQNIIFTVTVVSLLILMREKPNEPPSKTALTFRVLSQSGVKEDIQTLCRNSNFLLIALTFVIMWGNYISLGSILTPLF